VTEAAKEEFPPIDFEAETDEAIAVCNGDVRAALKASLIANAFLEDQLTIVVEMVSAGYGRGQVRKAAPPPKRQRYVTQSEA
jgi:hypothetical protein